MNAWIAFIQYLIYRCFRFVCHSVQIQVTWRFSGVSDHLREIARPSSSSPSSSKDCQLLSILYKQQLSKGSLSSANDFIWRHDQFVMAKDVLAPDPCWTLYTLDEEFVYFLRMPKPWPFYDAREAPFVFIRQFDVATKVARMPFKAFIRFAEESLPEPKGPVVCLNHAARSGSTLLTRAMQVSKDRIISFGEPAGFTALAMFHQRGLIPEGLTIDLLKAILKFCCKTQNPGQTYLIKLQAIAASIILLIKKAMPRVKHMFTYRRNTHRALIVSSLERVLQSVTYARVTVALRSISPRLYRLLFGADYEMLQLFRVRDCLDTAIVLHVVSWFYYHKFRDIFDIPIIYYEDLIERKEETLRPVFQICELPYDDFISEALKEFGHDSQGGTLVSRNNMKSVPDTPLDRSRVQKIYEVCDKLGVPRIGLGIFWSRCI